MKIGKYLIKADFGAKQKWYEYSYYKRYGQTVFTFGKFYLNFGEIQNCEHCEKELDYLTHPAICDECYEHYYCECGARLEDSYGSPGDGFCVRCR